ncbi:transglycosylase domain-containing protein [Streptomyces sp. NRRL F-2664]|uniref:transglycosylase domain-containing protein n=1 Tax=Streptomyces sp. NRRL F-2664 TaxID=1463842 RepID=UPI00068A3CB4|nr:transglycosylase domain-containing protein [Streptomyces sp. NRRL F-2664]
MLQKRQVGARRLRWVLLTLLLGAPGAAVAAAYVLVQVPPAQPSAVAQENTYYYSDGTLLAREGHLRRQNVRLSDIPGGVRQAVLAAEDRDFYTRGAIDPRAVLRGAWSTVVGKGRQSGSTITQQYVKNYYLSQDQSLSRKFREMVIAVKLGGVKSKDEILEGYLNTSYFGRGAYGIQAASQAYYGKDASNVSTEEGAYLAALLNAPSISDVANQPKGRGRVLARWNYVLDGMVAQGWLDRSRRAGMHFPEPLARTESARGLSGQRGYLVEAVKKYLYRHGVVDSEQFEAGGYLIWTSIDRQRQRGLQDAVAAEVTSKLQPGRRPEDRLLRVGGASIEPSTGRVVALYGGADYTKQYVSNATREDYSPGSLFKPLVFAAAVQSGARTGDGRPIGADTVYNGDSRLPIRVEGGYYIPENESNASYGPVTVRTAMERSVNTVFTQMAVDTGLDRVRETAIAMGVPQSAPGLLAGPALALGVAQVSVLDMASTYATLARRGEHCPWSIVDKMARSGGEAVALPERPVSSALSAEAADTTSDLLAGVIAKGTGRAAQGISRPAAGKTGTSEENRAAWFAGYTSELSTVVAVMGQDPDTGQLKSLHKALGTEVIHGGDHPARIWAAYMKRALG